MVNRDNIPPNFCSVPWLQLHTEPDGSIMPCCYYDIEDPIANWNTSSIIDAYHSAKWNDLRKAFLNNERPKQCNKCWKEEAETGQSMRTKFNCRYALSNRINDIEQYTLPTGEVHSSLALGTIDILFSNTCNYRCRTCGPKLSTAWINEAISYGDTNISKFDITTSEYFDIDIEKLLEKIDDSTEIHFSGGEPTLHDAHYKFLQHLIDMKKTNVSIRYNTNASIYTYKQYNLFDLLSNFQNVQIVCSIDALGRQGEYIKTGFSWDQTKNWIMAAKEKVPYAMFGVSAVYSIYNCFSAIVLHEYILTDPLFKYMTSDNNEVPFMFALNNLHYPIEMSPSVLPIDVKIEVIRNIIHHIEAHNLDDVSDCWKPIIRMLMSSDQSHLLSEFYDTTARHDAYRNESFEEIFPELHGEIQKCIS